VEDRLGDIPVKVFQTFDLGKRDWEVGREANPNNLRPFER